LLDKSHGIFDKFLDFSTSGIAIKEEELENYNPSQNILLDVIN